MQVQRLYIIYVNVFGIQMSKKLGQNFLIKRTVVDKIVQAAELEVGDAVLEVGPGIGTLTQGLATKWG